MIDYIDLIITFRTFLTSKRIINYWTIEPSRIIEGSEGRSIIIQNFFAEIVCCIQSSIINDNIFRVVGSIDCTSSWVVESIIWIISIGDVESEVTKYILEN